MAQYVVYVQGTSNTSANTEDEFIELTGAASTSYFLKRVRVNCNTANSDVAITARICLMTSAGANGTSYTPIRKRRLAPVATSTCKIKNGTTAFTLGTVTSTFHQDNVNGRAIWEWIPRGDEEFIDSGSAGILAVIIKVSAASVVLNVSCEFEE